MTTIHDVARKAGVSTATISRVLNGNSRVSEDTRPRVQEVVRELGYQPNLLGRNLRRTETLLVLVILPSISNPFYSRVVEGVEDVAHGAGYNVMLCNTASDPAREKMYLELLKSRRADGVIFMASSLNGSEMSEIAAGHPVVQCCEYLSDVPVAHVSIDNANAARQAVRHLIQLGRKRVAMISADNNFISTRQREDGFRQALDEAGLPWKPELLVHGGYGFKSGMRGVLQLLQEKERPDGIFAISDLSAIGAIKALRERDVSVPDDIAVVGFDGGTYGAMYEPSLTTIHQPRYDLGRSAMRMLLDQFRNGVGDRKSVVIEHELVVRASTLGAKAGLYLKNTTP